MADHGKTSEPTSMFSASVNRAIQSLGSTSTPVTGAQLVAAVAAVHPEYGHGLMGKVARDLDVDNGSRRSIDRWLRELLKLFPVAVEGSGSTVVHGRQMVLGLVELDEGIRSTLEPTGIITALRSEVGDVDAPQLPGRTGPTDTGQTMSGELPLTERALEWLQAGANLLGPGRAAAVDELVIVCVALFWGQHRPESSQLCASVLGRLASEAAPQLPPDPDSSSVPDPVRERGRYVEEVRRRAGLLNDPFVSAPPEEHAAIIAQTRRGELVGSAGTLSNRITRDGRVHSRHLLASAVLSIASGTRTDAPRILGLDEGTLAHIVIDTIGQQYPHEAGEWRTLVGDAPRSPGNDAGAPQSQDDGAGAPAPPEVGEVPLLHDQPARTDSLGRWALATELASVIDNLAAARERPEAFALHLDAPWGAGKSTIVGFLERQLKDPRRGSPEGAGTNGASATQRVASRPAAPWIVITMDAWRSSQLSPAWWALLGHLRRGCRSELGLLGRLRFDGLLFLRELRRLWRVWVPAAVVVVALAVLILTHTDLKALAGTGTSLTATITSLIAFIALVGGLGRRLTSLGTLQGARLHERFNDNPMEEVAAQISAIRRYTARPILLVLDDLDRCNERFAVELLDAVQTLLRTPLSASERARATEPSAAEPTPALVVLAVGDHRWLRAAYEDAYAVFAPYVSEPGRPLGHLFLDKLFQVRVEVPVLGRQQVSTYLQDLLTGHGAERGSADPAARHTLEDVKKRILAAPDETGPAETLDQKMAQILYEDASELPPDQRAEAVNAVLEARRSEGVHARLAHHMLVTYGDLLEPNPRAAKRFLMAYNLNLAARLSEYNKVDPAALALWTVLATRWPALADWIRDQLPRGPLRMAGQEGHPSRLLLDDEVQAVITSPKGGPLDAAKILGCLGLLDAGKPGEPA